MRQCCISYKVDDVYLSFLSFSLTYNYKTGSMSFKWIGLHTYTQAWSLNRVIQSEPIHAHETQHIHCINTYVRAKTVNNGGGSSWKFVVSKFSSVQARAMFMQHLLVYTHRLVKLYNQFQLTVCTVCLMLWVHNKCFT